MTTDAPTPDNNLALRQMRGMRKDMLEMMEREARVIDLLNRMNLRLDDLLSRTERGFSEIRSDLVLLDSRVLTTITEVRHASERLDEVAEDGA